MSTPCSSKHSAAYVTFAKHSPEQDTPQRFALSLSLSTPARRDQDDDDQDGRSRGFELELNEASRWSPCLVRFRWSLRASGRQSQRPSMGAMICPRTDGHAICVSLSTRNSGTFPQTPRFGNDRSFQRTRARVPRIFPQHSQYVPLCPDTSLHHSQKPNVESSIVPVVLCAGDDVGRLAGALKSGHVHSARKVGFYRSLLSIAAWGGGGAGARGWRPDG